MVKFIRINLNIGLITLIFRDTGTQSVQKFTEILKKRVFYVLCESIQKFI
jgi:hypothetical protein